MARKHGSKDPKYLREREGLYNRLYGGAAFFAEAQAVDKAERKAKKARALKAAARRAREEEM